MVMLRERASAPLDASAVDPAATPPRRLAGMAVVVVGLALAVLPGSPLWLVLAGAALALSVGLPLCVADAPRVASALVPVAVVVLAVVAGWASYARATGDGPIRDRTHDGGVIITRAAAEDLLALRNPYARDFTDELPASWLEVQGNDGEIVPNPVVDHFPYLPAAALVHVPFVAAADAAGWTWDPRIGGWLALVAAMVVLARRPDPAWRRLAAVTALGGPFAIVYLAWGTNDVLAVSLAVLALCWAERHPGWAGATLAVALSTKPLLAVLVPPLAVVVVLTGGARALRRWWTLPGVLVATCLPALLAGPTDFLDDAVWFNLGKADVNMPTSGLGLPAVAPGVFSGALLGLVTVVGLAVAVAGPIWAVRRWPSVWAAACASGLALLAVLVPARTFQVNYLVLVAALVPLGFLHAGSGDEVSDPVSERAVDPAT